MMAFWFRVRQVQVQVQIYLILAELDLDDIIKIQQEPKLLSNVFNCHSSALPHLSDEFRFDAGDNPQGRQYGYRTPHFKCRNAFSWIDDSFCTLKAP